MIRTVRTFLALLCTLPLIANGAPIVKNDSFAIERPNGQSAFIVESQVYASKSAATSFFMLKVKVPSAGFKEPPFFLGERVAWNTYERRWRLTVMTGLTVFSVAGYDSTPPLKEIEMLARALCLILYTSESDATCATSYKAYDTTGMSLSLRILHQNLTGRRTFEP